MSVLQNSQIVIAVGNGGLDKALASGNKASKLDPYGEGMIIAGEPLHDLLRLQSLTSVYANDSIDMLLDHKVALLRLSRVPISTAAAIPWRDPPLLSGQALELLQLAAKLPKSKYKRSRNNTSKSPGGAVPIYRRSVRPRCCRVAKRLPSHLAL